MNELLDRKAVSALINKHYTKTSNAVGNPAYDGLILLKNVLVTNVVWIK